MKIERWSVWLAISIRWLALSNEVYLEPNHISGRELAAKLGVAASTLSQPCPKGHEPCQPRNGLAAFQGAWPISGELACNAVQS